MIQGKPQGDLSPPSLPILDLQPPPLSIGQFNSLPAIGQRCSGPGVWGFTESDPIILDLNEKTAFLDPCLDPEVPSRGEGRKAVFDSVFNNGLEEQNRHFHLCGIQTRLNY
jgi:hypothetical protein